MPPVVAIGGAIFGAASAVASVAVAVVSTVAAVVGPVVAAVGSVVTGIVSTIGAVLGPVIETVGGIVEGISGAIQGAVELIRTTVAEPIANIVEALKKGIGDIAKAITEPLKPILDPIKDTLVTVRDFMADTQLWVETQLKPVAELISVINTISAVNFVKMLLEGTEDIGKIIGDVADESGLKTAEAITVLWRETVQIGTGIMDNVRDHYTLLGDTIDDTDERLRADMQLSIEYAKGTIQGEIDKVRDALSEQLTPMELQIAGIERRTMDLPFFQQMLIRALQ